MINEKQIQRLSTLFSIQGVFNLVRTGRAILIEQIYQNCLYMELIENSWLGNQNNKDTIFA